MTNYSCILIYKIIFILSLIFSSPASAQGIISGWITDRQSNERLAGAQVFDPLTHTGVLSNQAGFFSIRTTPEMRSLAIRLSGYQPVNLPISGKDTLLMLALVPFSTDSVLIMAELPESQLGIKEVQPLTLRRVPALAGESDLLKVLALMPGVASGMEGSSGLYVRGGTPDQNLILLDDAPVYNVTHLFGFVSLFNTDIISRATLYTGGFPARFGGRVSSVLDIGIREGSTLKRTSSIGISPIAFRFSTEGYLNKGKTGYLLATRATYTDLLFLPSWLLYRSGNTDSHRAYRMGDVNLKINHTFPDHSRIIASLYAGIDHYHTLRGNRKDTTNLRLSADALKWYNLTGTLRYQKSLGNQWFLKAIAITSRYAYQSGGESIRNTAKPDTPPAFDTLTSTLQSGIRDIGVKTQLDYFSNRVSATVGMEATAHLFDFINQQVNKPDSGDVSYWVNTRQRKTIGDLAVFGEAAFRPSEKWMIQPGIRLALFTGMTLPFWAIEPRLNVLYHPTQTLTVKATYSRMTQFLHVLSSYGIGLPNDLWVPASATAPPQISHQVSLGGEWPLPGTKTRISVEGYYKALRNQVDYRQGIYFDRNLSNWEALVATGGQGRAWGAECMIHKSAGKRLTGWVSYTLSWSQRRFEEIQDNAWYWLKYDRRHILATTGNLMLGKRWSLACTWTYYTGAWATLPVAFIMGSNGIGTPVYAQRNNSRLPDYHRCDIGATLAPRKKNGGQWQFGVYNAYNRHNPLYVSYEMNPVYGTTAGNTQPPLTGYQPTITPVSLLPIIPYISYARTF